MRWLIFLLPMLAWAQAPASVHGSVKDTSAEIRLTPVDRPEGALQGRVDANGRFQFANIAPGWYILSAAAERAENVKAVHVREGLDIDIGDVSPLAHVSVCAGCWMVRTADSPPPVPILSVCEALTRPLNFDPVIIVGIFKSGMDPTLRQDCPNELRSGDVCWLSAIALYGSTEPPDQYRDQIEKKVAEIYASYPTAAKPRPERLVGLYGILIMPGGLTSAPCCHAAAETTFAPARLIGIDEKDRRVIR